MIVGCEDGETDIAVLPWADFEIVFLGDQRSETNVLDHGGREAYEQDKEYLVP